MSDNPDDIFKYLFDIFDSIVIVETYFSNINSLSEYKKSLMTIDAIERRLAIIGEALNKAVKLNPQLNVSNKIKIIGLRHLLVHDYDKSDASIIWTILQKDIPVLKREVELLLKGYNGSTIN